jgi:hypothetical protein
MFFILFYTNGKIMGIDDGADQSYSRRPNKLD